ncbi:unnamed protein product [Paramecium octaurelia]|uniref:Uncharacterized protein n=1 Tax=Paramecium octaurelia TaxID=43137 RepID=A0A8S1VV07_PAROT|nr:unnamed protein product [Paramecium octaurelia]
MFNCITVQTLPPEQIKSFQVPLNFQGVQDIKTKCAQCLNYDVQLFLDKECKQEIDSSLRLCQARQTNIIYAKRVDLTYDSSYFPKVTCWFKQDGIELNMGVILNSDYSFDEVLQEAKQKEIIVKMPNSIIVTDLDQTKILASMIQMQMLKLISPSDTDPQLLIHFTTTGQEPQVQLQQKNGFPQFQFPQNPIRPQGNQGTLQPSGLQIKKNQFPIFSLQSKPQNKFNNNKVQIQESVFPPSNFEIQKRQQPPKPQPFMNPFVNPPNNTATVFKTIDSQVFQQKDQNKANDIASLERMALKCVEQKIHVGKFILIINENSDFVTYQCSSPQLSGYFLQVKGRNAPLKNEQQIKWESKYGVQIADNVGKGFIIKWKNNTYNSLTIYLM